jgi:hypothetical protein
MEYELMDKFDKFLKEQNIQLHKIQRHVCVILIEEVVKNNAVRCFLTSRRTGKTTLFNLLEKFFSSVEVLDQSDFINPY